MRARALLLATLAALLGAFAASPLPALAAGAPQGIAEGFPTKCGVESLAVGREGNVWFACTVETNFGYGTVPKVGLVTPAGKVSEFGGGHFPKNTEPGPIGVAPNGNLWFPLNSYYQVFENKRKPPQIATVTPSSKVTTTPVPLSSKYDVTDLVASPSGYLWFSTATHLEAKAAALWQITPAGTISKLPIELGTAYPALAIGSEGDLWFTEKPASGVAKEVLVRLAPGGTPTELGANIPGFAPGDPIFAPDGSAWFFTGTTPPGVGRIGAAGEITDTGARIEATGGTIAGSTIGADGNLWFGFREGPGTSAIERVTPNGQVTPFTDCLKYGQPYFGPNSLVTGADGDIYFTSLASRELPSISDPPSIGRITPSGEITQIYAGVRGEARSILAGPDGAIWFSAGGDEIQRLAPITGPVNTFRVAPLRNVSPSGAATARVVLPGPGTVSLKPLAFVPRHHKPVRITGTTATATSAVCGSTGLPIKPVGAAKRAFYQRGFTIEEVAVTFTPTGGTPYTENARLYFSGGTPHEKRSQHPAGPPPPGKHRGDPLRVPQAGRHYRVRPATLRFSYQAAGSYGEEEKSGPPLYPPFTLTGLGHWREWHKREERHGVPAEAVASGFIHYDTCTPDCARGRQVTAPAQVKLDGEDFCFISGGRDVQIFDRVTVRVGNGPPRTRFIQCSGRLRPGKRSDVIPPGVGFYH
jgi:streptogramin lyase